MRVTYNGNEVPILKETSDVPASENDPKSMIHKDVVYAIYDDLVDWFYKNSTKPVTHVSEIHDIFKRHIDG